MFEWWIESRRGYGVLIVQIMKVIVAYSYECRVLGLRVYNRTLHPTTDPNQYPPLELLSRAGLSVGIYRTVPMVPTQGEISEEGR